MKFNKTILSVGTLTLLLTAGAVAGASAYQGDYTKKGLAFSPERHESMTSAFENKDYNAWKELMTGRGRVKQVVNESNFAQFAEAHRLGQAGDIAGADAIRSELGLRTSNGEKMGAGYKGANGDRSGQGQKQGHRQGNRGSNFVDNNGDGVCDGNCNNLN